MRYVGAGAGAPDAASIGARATGVLIGSGPISWAQPCSSESALASWQGSWSALLLAGSADPTQLASAGNCSTASTAASAQARILAVTPIRIALRRVLLIGTRFR